MRPSGCTRLHPLQLVSSERDVILTAPIPFRVELRWLQIDSQLRQARVIAGITLPVKDAYQVLLAGVSKGKAIKRPARCSRVSRC